MTCERTSRIAVIQPKAASAMATAPGPRSLITGRPVEGPTRSSTSAPRISGSA